MKELHQTMKCPIQRAKQMIKEKTQKIKYISESKNFENGSKTQKRKAECGCAQNKKY